jgi:HAD superfamily hydrolase (TIGR01484 family)
MTIEIKPNLSSVRYVFTDVDDTLTTRGKLLPETLAALYRLKEKGYIVVPVTGACAGWCDQIVRLWPVDAVIGENGAFLMQLVEGQPLRIDFWGDKNIMAARQLELRGIVQSLLANTTGLTLSKDHNYRLCDVAIDYRQDNKTDSLLSAQEVVNAITKHGAHARFSSIHINAWFGDFNKLSMTQRVLKNIFKLPYSKILEQVAFIGDAPNDEPMFEFFEHTFGVGNIRHHLPQMTYHPNTILSKEGGLGFVEFSELLLATNEALIP